MYNYLSVKWIYISKMGCRQHMIVVVLVYIYDHSSSVHQKGNLTNVRRHIWFESPTQTTKWSPASWPAQSRSLLHRKTTTYQSTSFMCPRSGLESIHCPELGGSRIILTLITIFYSSLTSLYIVTLISRLNYRGRVTPICVSKLGH